MAYDKDYIKNTLEIEQVQQVCEGLGAFVQRRGEGMLVMDTICHNLPGEGSQKLYYYDNTKLFRCYTDCSEYFDLFQLIIKANETQYEEEMELFKAVAYVAQMFGFESVEEDGFDNNLEDWLILNKFSNRKNKGEKKRVSDNFLKSYDEDILDRLPHPLVYPWFKEGISRETQNRFEIGYYAGGCQITIPHRDIDGRMIGLRGRSLVKEECDIYGKYRPITINNTMYNHPLGFSLYGLNYNKENIKKSKIAIVWEGEKSVMLYDSLFGANNNISVACCGSSFSMHQFNLLRELGVQEIVLAFDRQFQELGDLEFKRHVKHLKALGDKYKNYVKISCLFDKEMLTGYKDSPIDCGKETFLHLFK